MRNVHDCITKVTIGAALLLGGLAGCADSTTNQPPPSSASAQLTGAAVNAPASEETLSDGQIVGIASAVDGAEVAAGKLALSHVASPAARRFAEHMVTAHGSMDAKLMSVAGSQGIAIAESNLCKKLRSDTAAEGETLASMSGARFDQSYVAAQLKGHEDVLNLLDTKLIPDAQNPTLKAALVETRAKVVEHIRMAQAAQASLGAP